MIANEPGRRSVIAVGGWWGRYQHLKRQLCERTGWHDEKLLVLDEVFNLSEQGLIEPVGAGVIEGQRLSGIAVRIGVMLAGQLLATLALPRRLVETAAQRLHLLCQRFRSKGGTYPTACRFGHDPDEALFGHRTQIPGIEKQHQRFIISEQRLHLFHGNRSKAQQFSIVREVRRHLFVDLLDPRVDGGKPRDVLRFGLRVALLRGLAESGVAQTIALLPFR